MATARDLVDPLAGLARKCLDRGEYASAERLCGMLRAVASDRWAQLPDDEKAHWLGRLADLLHVRALGDGWAYDDPDYDRARELTDALRRAVD